MLPGFRGCFFFGTFIQLCGAYWVLNNGFVEPSENSYGTDEEKRD